MKSKKQSVFSCFVRAFLPKTLRVLLCLSFLGVSTTFTQLLRAQESPEYALKAVFLYNFAVFTAWPNHSTDNFNLCIYGKDPFGRDLDSLMKRKRIYERVVDIHRISNVAQLNQCQLVFISSSAFDNLAGVIDTLKDKPVLTIADSPGACEQGVVLNMSVKQDKVTFEANLTMAKKAGLNLSSKLLRLATEIH